MCRGVCGEPCPKCIECHVEKGEKCSLSLEPLAKIDRVYQLECGHVFDLAMLDRYMDTFSGDGADGHRSIRAVVCPTCKQQVHMAPRYNAQVKRQLALIDAVKRELEKKYAHPQGLSDEERRQVDRAMGEGMHSGTGAGHWFACPNGHPYFIADCGGAMVESTCPECGCRVGGTNHTLTQGNTFVANFAGDGDSRPAWPGMG